MIALHTPNGLDAQVPETEAEDPSPRFAAHDLAGIKAYYDEYGYVVIKGLLDPTACDTVRALWDTEIKPSSDLIYRQQNSRLERHRFNEQGWVMNPILNPHAVDPRRYPRFRNAVREHVLSGPNYARIAQHLLGERPKIVQAMYFEGNSETWEHQDSYYLDSEQIGAMAGAWFALEDIAPTAGRFFICPKSHRFEWPRRRLKDNAQDTHEAFIQSVIETFRASDSEVRAPTLSKGDAIIWHACTIHGALGSHDAVRSRSAITCHAIPASHRFMTLHHKVVNVPTEKVGDVLIHSPKDLARGYHRALAWAEANYPELYWKVKKNLRRVEVRLDMLRGE